MATYNGPEGERIYSVKFLRLDEVIYVNKYDGSWNPNHKDIAKEEGIDTEIERLRVGEPHRVDGGKLIMLAGDLLVCDQSGGYQISESNPGRPFTVKLVEEQSVGWRVFSNTMKFHRAHRVSHLDHNWANPKKEVGLRQDAAKYVLGRELTEEELQGIMNVSLDTLNLADFSRKHPGIPLAVHLGANHFFEHLGYLSGKHFTVAYPLKNSHHVEVTIKEPKVSS